MTIQGNTALVAYGIQTEQSDLRAHVCVKAQRIYVYPTRSGVAAVQSGRYRKAPAYTRDIQTAEGYLIPPDAIDGCVCWRIPPNWFADAHFDERATPTEKGARALWLVQCAIRHGAFSLPADPDVVTDAKTQITGADLIVTVTARIQVKCDWNGGHTKYGGTGNLFIQVAECNPFGQH
jgi:hypothetical protein